VKSPEDITPEEHDDERKSVLWRIGGHRVLAVVVTRLCASSRKTICAIWSARNLLEVSDGEMVSISSPLFTSRRNFPENALLVVLIYGGAIFHWFNLSSRSLNARATLRRFWIPFADASCPVVKCISAKEITSHRCSISQRLVRCDRFSTSTIFIDDGFGKRTRRVLSLGALPTVGV
jgi:hypothetical protein